MNGSQHISSTYIWYTGFLMLFPSCLIILMICQLLVVKYGTHKIKDKVMQILLYCIYGAAFACTLCGYSLHRSKEWPLWCKYYGIPPCFAIYGAAKGFLYAFFLRRARKAQSYDIEKSKCKQLFFDRVAPIYVILYWICYVTLASILFTGSPTDLELNPEQIISYCSFDAWSLWFIISANLIDAFNCGALLSLFVVPLLKSIQRLKEQKMNDRLLNKYIIMMKWNVVLSFIATLSSVVTIGVIKASHEYIWLLCAADPFINSMCAFLMMAPNRSFIAKKCGKCFSDSKVTVNEDTSKAQKDLMITMSLQNETKHHKRTTLISYSKSIPMIQFQKLAKVPKSLSLPELKRNKSY